MQSLTQKQKMQRWQITRKATGLEALMGYLYLKEDTKRIIELIKTGLDMAESQKKKGQEQA